MSVQTMFLPFGLKTIFPGGFENLAKGQNAWRVIIMASVVVLAVVVGPRGLAVGPTQSRSTTPALPTGAAMETQTVLDSITVSFELIQTQSDLERQQASYPTRQVGPLRFPDGAIDVPWTPAAVNPRQDREPDYANSRVSGPAGSTISGPRRNQVPQVLNTSLGNQISAPAARPSMPVPRSGVLANGDWRSVVIFNGQGADLTSEAATALSDIAGALGGTPARIELMAYGGSTAERSHSARRLSLRRALAVRNHLMANGMDQEQIAVRALGGATDGGPASRVDLIIPSR